MEGYALFRWLCALWKKAYAGGYAQVMRMLFSGTPLIWAFLRFSHGFFVFLRLSRVLLWFLWFLVACLEVLFEVFLTYFYYQPYVESRAAHLKPHLFILIILKLY